MFPTNMTESQNSLFQENHNRSQNEEVLYTQWRDATNIIAQLNEKIESMKQTIGVLENKCKALETANNTNANQENAYVSYVTDEEELAQETEWLRVKQNRKKRKLNTSITPPQLKGVISKPIPTKVEIKKTLPPPPIIVDSIKNYEEFYDKINETIPTEKFNTKLMNGNSIKINTDDSETYREITSILVKGSHTWHSYENKQNRPIRVMALNLHQSCKPDRIISDLQKKGYKAINAAVKLKWKTKEPLNIFMITFNADEDINKIFGINNILGSKVEIQPIKKSKMIPQCKNCQSYGHTQKYCNKEPRCVKCAGKHHTTNCIKPKDTQPKCIHCGENHPANYRGCIVAIELQKIKNKNMKPKSLKEPERHKTLDEKKTQSKIIEKVKLSNEYIPQEDNSKTTYAHAVTYHNCEKQPNKVQHTDINLTLQLILNKLNIFDERLKKLEYSAQGAIPKQKDGQRH